ncbi:Thiol-disulfide isomerase or thioredoxin [Zobellia uliginosa]|uniref:Thiol-disulfide isomerase or thioredoxin n=1 Tax=Zobellia uliginosa TaxID=143224 RepID=A0ABY1KXQ9_9FLAO|nr:TlpA disulfide reductase family protein [Zobellia uliginosa]SIS89868.1 Thiol-disulfide isomerase or thioredoxin [Zobellia uliginosa]
MFTSLGPRLRAIGGRLISYTSIKLKTEKTLPEETYEWVVTDLKGNPHVFKEEKGKVIFLNLWATWCKPCLEEMPDIKSLYKDYGDRVDFILVSEEEPDRVRSFELKKGYGLPFYLAESPIPEIFASKTIPTTYILSRQGKIVKAENGVVDWNGAEIRKLLDQLIAE